jgi:hypothetical protein
VTQCFIGQGGVLGFEKVFLAKRTEQIWGFARGIPAAKPPWTACSPAAAFGHGSLLPVQGFFTPWSLRCERSVVPAAGCALSGMRLVFGKTN